VDADAYEPIQGTDGSFFFVWGVSDFFGTDVML
jgi:hypothetical protein